MAAKKIYVVKFDIGRSEDDLDAVHVKAFASRLKASVYVEDKAKELFKESFRPENGAWDDPWHYWYKPDSNPANEYMWEIEEVEVEDGVDLPDIPDVEKENKALKAENAKLKIDAEKMSSQIAAAECWLSMWDGGWDYGKEIILENVNAAKAILKGSKEADSKIHEMFEAWLKTRDLSKNDN